jgi:hypothetical protein
LKLLTCLLLCCATSAFANGSAPPPEPPKKTIPTPPRQAQLQGQLQGQGQTNYSPSSAEAGAGASVVDQSQSHFDALSWGFVLPASVWTPPMPKPEVPEGCPAPTETQNALEVGKGVIYSEANSLRDNNPCIAIYFSRGYWNRCQYKSASRAYDVGMRLYAKQAGVDWSAEPRADLTDYTPETCALLATPVRPTPPVPDLTQFTSPPPAPPACQEAPRKPPKKASRPNKGCAR